MMQLQFHIKLEFGIKLFCILSREENWRISGWNPLLYAKTNNKANSLLYQWLENQTEPRC